VTDQLRGSSAHRVEIFWHFATECQLTLAEGTATATRDGVALVLRWPAPLTARLVCGRENPPLGWVSDRFDTKTPTQTLVCSGTGGAGWQGLTTIQISLPAA
jgi:Heparinase II/III-like protein